MSKRVSDGNTIPHTPVGAITAGDLVLQVDLFGIADADIAAGALGSLSVQGVYELPKEATTEVFAVGTILYWDATPGELTATASTHKVIGKSVTVQGATTTTGRVLLTP